jgi:hypothetical protein
VWATGDAAALDPLWSAKSAAAKRRVAIEMEQTARVECNALAVETIDGVNGDDAATTVRATIIRTNPLRLADRVDNPLLTAFIIGNLGNLKLKQAKYAEAMTYLERAALSHLSMTSPA